MKTKNIIRIICGFVFAGAVVYYLLNNNYIMAGFQFFILLFLIIIPLIYKRYE